MWDNWKVNERFMSSLRCEFGAREFRLMDAYGVYARKHADKRRKHGLKVPQGYKGETYQVPWTQVVTDAWIQMNVRNTLCKAVYDGGHGLIRTKPGTYRFTKS